MKSLLQAQGLHVLEGSGARKACETGQAADTAGHRSVFMMRYSTEDLSKLPDELTQRIKTERFADAAVGACPAPPGGGFSQYQMAILLYQ